MNFIDKLLNLRRKAEGNPAIFTHAQARALVDVARWTKEYLSECDNISPDYGHKILCRKKLDESLSYLEGLLEDPKTPK